MSSDTSGLAGPYARELAVALDAARDAGTILLDAYYAPGGPPGSGGKSRADLAAELAIRKRLSDGFPAYGLRGEELPELNRLPDASTKAAGYPRWLVDPNDGTDAFLHGRRGAAVSIALVVGERPVLGVVYAYAARSGLGDLFWWAEGSDLFRNGRRVEAGDRVRVAGTPVVLASGGADTASAANVAACAPFRVRAEPSIAWRLALAAAGEADAAFSIFNPNDYDVAGGHALLLGAGGDLYAEGGRPVRYESSASPDGSWARVGDCWGGVGSVPADLSLRDWSSLKRIRHQRHPDYPFMASDKAMIWNGDPGVLDRACGALLGMVSGDSLGSLVEFQTPQDIAARYPGGPDVPAGPRDMENGGTWNTLAGQPTDDSELGILLARSIVKAGGYDQAEAARAYAFWHATAPFDEGRTCARAFSAAGAQASPEDTRRAMLDAAAADMASQANGALMRLAPLAVFGWNMDPERVAKLAMDDAALSHAHPVCLAANAAYAVALASLIGGSGRQAALDAAALVVNGQSRESVRLAFSDALAKGPPEDATVNMGWVLVAFRNACARLAAGGGPVEAIRDTAAMGGDADTNAAIAGALVGAAAGAEAFPAGWRAAVLSARPLDGVYGRPRPEPLWPVDIFRLAERLVVLGGRP
ncbi:MAG: ADP-ribosylglycohydrolase family protein [Spirochaetales bacterium]|nr:ADP-ribosylglycohydrolase family protein [Spirochaetales bacterium]MBP7262735.1 ADP-ribosylglycohydrolase family protein [Spirochaetia bacterium]